MRSLARSAKVMMIQVALSVSRQQSKRVGAGFDDPAGAENVVHRHALLHQGLGIIARVVAVGHLDVGEVFAGDSVLHHVARESKGEGLERAGEPVRTAQQVGGRNRRRRSRARAADSNLRVAVHRSEDRDRLAHASLYRADGKPDEGLAARSAAGAVHVEVEPDAHVVGEGGRGGRVAAVIAEHPIDVLRSQASVGHGVEDSLGRQRPGAAARSSAVVGFSDADNAVPVLEIAVHLHLLNLRTAQSPAPRRLRV